MRGTMVLALLAAVAANGRSANAQVPTGEVVISGTSSVRNWSCKATNIQSSLTAGANFASAVMNGQKAVQSAALTFPVSGIDCENGTMNGHMREALKAKQHPTITYRMTSYQLGQPTATGIPVRVDGEMTIAGQTRPLTVQATATRPSAGVLRLKGETTFDMTNWGVKPPTLFFGTLKVRPPVTIRFDVPLSATGSSMLDPAQPMLLLADPAPTADPANPPQQPWPHWVSYLVPKIRVQHFVPRDQRGIDMFESPKTPAGPSFEGFTLQLGAAFTLVYQGLHDSNTAVPVIVSGVNLNELVPIGPGINNGLANGYVDVQLAPGIRVLLTAYLSSKHHPEAYVKSGYVLIDESPIRWQPLEQIMRYTTLKLGQFVINYGDAHFRRSDNGQTLQNPFMGDLILDAFTTETGGEIYVRPGPWITMLGIMNGEIHGEVRFPDERSAAVYGKLGFDKFVTRDLRLRLTGSLLGQPRAVDNTLYHGNRAGTQFWFVLENTLSSSSVQSWSGTIDPGFTSEVHAFMINPFIQYKGLEFFGVAERARGRAADEPANRTWHQYAGDVVYRFLPRIPRVGDPWPTRLDRLYVGARYDWTKGELLGIPNDVKVHRWAIAGGWFITPTMLAKFEYLRQEYDDFPPTDIRNGGEFHGFMASGVIAF